jgi:TPR repeat protein
MTFFYLRNFPLALFFSLSIISSPFLQANEKNTAEEQLLEQATQEALVLMQRADAGDIGSQYFLGEISLRVKKYDDAEKWLLMAAKQGDVISQNLLAHAYLGPIKNIEQGLYWLVKAAEQNSIHAQAFLGDIYGSDFNGELAVDFKKSAYWYKKAAANGDKNAQYNLASMYRMGEGVLIDYKLSVDWYRKSALQGYGLAQHNLGIMYDRGIGVESDHNTAYM